MLILLSCKKYSGKYSATLAILGTRSARSGQTNYQKGPICADT